MSRVTANEDQLKKSLELNIKQTHMQNVVIEDLSKKIGSAGLALEAITRAAHSPKRTDESSRKEIIKILAKFNATVAKGARGVKGGMRE